jgi:hypothetical protein
MSKEINCTNPDFFRVLQQAMQTYALSITAGYCTNGKELAAKERLPIRLPESLSPEDYKVIESTIGERTISEGKMRTMIAKARREKTTTIAEAFKADLKEWRAGQKEIRDAFSKMNAELSLRLNPDSEAAGRIAEYETEASQQDRYQKSWKRLEEKYAAKASADVESLRSKIASATDQKGWKALMGTYSSSINQLKMIAKHTADGQPCGDHGPTDSDLRVWILKAITNPHLSQVQVKAALDEHGTCYSYANIVHDVGLIFKAQPQWDIGSETVLAFSVRTSAVKRRSEEEPSTVECFRCRRTGHYASSCKSETCVSCGAVLTAAKHYCSKGKATGDQHRSKRRATNPRRGFQPAKGGNPMTDAGGASSGKGTPGVQKTLRIKPSWGTISAVELGEEVKAMLAKTSGSN